MGFLRDRTPGRVPVAGREHRAAEVERRRVAAKQLRKQRKKRTSGISIFRTAIFLVIIILVVLMVSVPLRNYFEQRGEITRAVARVAALQSQEKDLHEQLDQWKSDDFVRQQARKRLGAIEPGERAYRVLSEAPVDGDDDPQHQEAAAHHTGEHWWQVMWRSVATGSPVLPGTEPHQRLARTEAPTLPLPKDLPRQPEGGANPGDPDLPPAPAQH